MKINNVLANLYKASYAPVMATGIISISLYAHRFFILSRAVLAICSLFFLVLLSLSVWNSIKSHSLAFIHPKKERFNNFTFLAGLSLLLMRISLISSPFSLFIIGGILFFVVLFYTVAFIAVLLARKRFSVSEASALWLVSEIPLLSTSILLSWLGHVNRGLSNLLVIFILVSYFMAVVFYTPILILNLLRWLRRGIWVEKISGITWITMGFGGLISIASYYLVLYDSLNFQVYKVVYLIMILSFIVASFLLPVITYLSMLKLKASRTYGYNASLWSSLFPISVYSLTSFIFSKICHSPIIYNYSLIFEFLSLVLLVLYILLLFVPPGIVRKGQDRK
ncbi:MAG: hypothetical protein LVQ96_04930 [Thermoplasmatales archaeon]|nr:hypothetical protein [Thermoplasmatales archaeon]MCW6170497.1 hypothetical protein [Thermoplasmatales archaeon]